MKKLAEIQNVENEDKEAFEKWFENNWQDSDDKDVFTQAWQAACEYKQKEIDDLKKVNDMERYVSSEYRKVIHEVLNSSNPNQKLSPNDAKFLLNQLLELSKKPAKSISESSPETYLKMRAQREKLQAENAKLRECVMFYAELTPVNLGLGYQAKQCLKELGY